MMEFGQHKDLFDRFSKLIAEHSPDMTVMQEWARFMTVAEAGDLEAIVHAMEKDAAMIAVLTQNLSDKLALIGKGSEAEWGALFEKEKAYLELHS